MQVKQSQYGKGCQNGLNSLQKPKGLIFITTKTYQMGKWKTRIKLKRKISLNVEVLCVEKFQAFFT